MEAKLMKVENSEAYIEITVDETAIEHGMNQAYKKVVKKLNVPGFRKGKAPRAILAAHYGKEIFYSDALEAIVPDAYEEALTRLDITPIAQPEFDFPEDDIDKVFSFSVIVPVKPEFTLGKIEEIDVTIPKLDLLERDVENALKDMQDRYALLVERAEDEPAEYNDKVNIDFEGFVNDEPFEGGKAAGYSLVLGSNSFIPGFEDQLVGLRKGEKKDLEVYFPSKYHNQELADKKAVFKVTLNKIEHKQLRELNDEFAQEVSEFDTLEEMKADVREKAEKHLNDRKREMIKSEVLKKAVDDCEIVVPDAVVEERTKKMLQQLQQSMAMKGITLEQYFKFSNGSEEEFYKDVWPEAELNVRIDFMLEKIAEEKGFEANDEELEEYINDIAEDVSISVDKTKEILGPNMDSVRLNIRINKAVDYLVDNALVTEEELPEDEGAPEAEAQIGEKSGETESPE
ncbi:MAG: trigger factor [Syntrophomonadaceae bacterium]|jgi:trigger factor|nr:trigger factor [Syntrophomonadaceae bacterium]